MTYSIGNTITDVITLRDDSNVAITGLLEDDFTTLEAYLASTPASTQLVAIDEVDEGQYVIEFTPDIAGPWAFHYVYDVNPVFREDTRLYYVLSSPQVVVSSAGGSWTYEGDLDDPAQEVRFLIQDTDGDYPLFTDAEVAYALGASNDNARRAAISLVERLLVRYSAMADTTELDLSVRAGQLYDHAKDLLRTLKMSFNSGLSVVPYAGGISYADIEVNEANRDRFTGVFNRGVPARMNRWGGIV